ncbi:SdpI family protein [Ferruginibacter sp.]
MKKNWVTLAVFIIWLLPALYFIKIYNNLPPQVPLHFGLNGKPDRYGSKDELMGVMALLSVISLGVYFLVKYLPKIDPKKTASYSSNTFSSIALVVVVFLAALQLLIINASVNGSFALSKFLFPLLGLFFTFLGNLMFSVKPNYFVGIRTPWTLENANTWRVTHQLAGKMWFAGGIAIAVICLLLPFTVATIVFISITLIITLIPVIYSYTYYKKHQHQ